MKKMLLMWCLLIGLLPAGYAQTRPSIGAPLEKAKGLQKELKLTDVQTEKIEAIYKESAEKYETIKKTEHGNSARMAKSLQPLRAATAIKIKAVLTTEEAAKFDNLIKHQKKTGVDWTAGWA